LNAIKIPKYERLRSNTLKDLKKSEKKLNTDDTDQTDKNRYYSALQNILILFSNQATAKGS
jgi:hypothetical protein